VYFVSTGNPPAVTYDFPRMEPGTPLSAARQPLKVFVTGSAGYIGRHLCAHLQSRGFEITRAVRALVGPNAGPRCVATGDLADSRGLDEMLAGHDVVVHLAGLAHLSQKPAAAMRAQYLRANVDATRNVARAAADAGVRRFVFVSTVGVLGGRSDRPFTEADRPAPVGPYAESKWLAECALAETIGATSMEAVVVRPTLTYGPRCPGNMSRLARLVASGVPLPLGGLQARRSLIGIANLVTFIESTIGHPAAANQTFLAADGDDVFLADIIRYLAEGLGVPVRCLRSPPAAVSFAARLLGQKAAFDKLTASLTVDVSKARKLLDWKAPVPIADGLRETGRSFARRAS